MDCFLKNDSNLFTSGIDSKETIIWFDNAEVVLDHRGCPWLWVHVTVRAIHGAGRTCGNQFSPPTLETVPKNIFMGGIL